MNLARPFRIITTLAAVVAAAFGMGTYTHPDLTNIHILFGFIFTLAFLLLSIMAVFTSGLRRLGAIGIVYAVIIPIFGFKQQIIPPVGNLHWLVETVHLALGFGALALTGVIIERFFTRRKTVANKVSTTSKAA